MGMPWIGVEVKLGGGGGRRFNFIIILQCLGGIRAMSANSFIGSWYVLYSLTTTTTNHHHHQREINPSKKGARARSSAYCYSAAGNCYWWQWEGEGKAGGGGGIINVCAVAFRGAVHDERAKSSTAVIHHATVRGGECLCCNSSTFSLDPPMIDSDRCRCCESFTHIGSASLCQFINFQLTSHGTVVKCFSNVDTRTVTYWYVDFRYLNISSFVDDFFSSLKLQFSMHFFLRYPVQLQEYLHRGCLGIYLLQQYFSSVNINGIQLHECDFWVDFIYSISRLCKVDASIL